MTERVKINCGDCKFADDCVDYGWDGCKKFTPKPREPMTEQEYIQICNTEQLVEELLAWWFDGANNYSEFGLYSWEVDEAKERIVEWLKQPHTFK